MKADDAPVSIGGMLGREAQRREVSHDAAAELLGVSQATFSRWVNGDNPPSSVYWTKIARFLSLPREEVGRLAQAQRTASKHDLAARIGGIESRLDALTDLVERALRRRGAR